MDNYRIIGVMSGTSMDGLDLASCVFVKEKDRWAFEITCAETIPYDNAWLVRLSQLHRQPIHLYPKTDMFYGKYIGQCIQAFMQKHNLQADLIASHGHTIFHRPEEGYTAQIGNGAAIHAVTGLPVVCDFRTMDVASGGQGAPLVPVGDALLFPQYEACLNLGGFANISYASGERRVAFDTGPCNIVLNKAAQRLGKAYDAAGAIAASGKVDAALLERLNMLPYYQLKGAKSLGREWMDELFWPIVDAAELSAEDTLATLSEHIAEHVSAAIGNKQDAKVLVTGGGAFNTHLIECIRKRTAATLVIPDPDLVQFKEALVFAFLGLLRVRGEHNSLRSVTGANADSIGGALFGKY
jgi:anhydro-N-acetylmuramic acid kinase